MANKQRLDSLIVSRGIVATRSQAENYIKLNQVLVNNKIINKPGSLVDDTADIKLQVEEQYVSRAALKLDSISNSFKLDFTAKTVLDVGSSTGGFTDYALKHGASKVYAVEKGSSQLHPSLRTNPKIELHEKTDIRDFKPLHSIDIVLIDVSFMSIRQILPHVASITSDKTAIIAMVKPQFEARLNQFKHKGVIKNDKLRRQILKDFENWATQSFVILNKADSKIAGAKGNLEKFYFLKNKHKNQQDGKL